MAEVASVPTVTPPISADMIKDSALLYIRDIYLWNTQVPSTFNTHSFTDLEAMLEGIRPYSAEPGFTSAVDRWSFAMKKTEWDKVSGGLNLSAGASSAKGDFGLSIFFRVEGDLRVSLAEPNSPAGLAGIRRGWRITKINNNSNITTGNTSFITNNVYEAESTSFTFVKPDGNAVNISLNAAHYKEKPVYLDTIYTNNNKKTGYLVFNSFLGDQEQISSEFQRVFNRFAGAGITNLVIDLRYNGGGYVTVQEKLANYIVNASANGAVMMKQIYNNANSGSNEITKFRKAGSLNLPAIYFIVGKNTASASELLINNLKPYMDVRLLGASATHGKPVGFFPIAVGEWYIFPVSFRTTNKNGEGNYFNGIPVNGRVADGLNKDWGDITEASLSSALNHIVSGNFKVNNQPTEKESLPVTQGNSLLEKQHLKIMIGASKK